MADNSDPLRSRRVYLISEDRLTGPDDLIAGRSDDVGIRASARAAYERLRDALPDATASLCLRSPVRRAEQTANRIAAEVDWEVAEPLAPREFGSWTGRPWSDVRTTDPGRTEAFWNDYARGRAPGGESLGDVSERADLMLTELGNRARWDHAIVVTHPDVIRAVVLHVLEAPLKMATRVHVEPLSVTRLSHGWMGWTLDSLNHTP